MAPTDPVLAADGAPAGELTDAAGYRRLATAVVDGFVIDHM
jgi:hypothetical protein